MIEGSHGAVEARLSTRHRAASHQGSTLRPKADPDVTQDEDEDEEGQQEDEEDDQDDDDDDGDDGVDGNDDDSQRSEASPRAWA